jgi:hypothetical protein
MAARVLAFPQHLPAQVPHRHPVRRSVAAAAIAGVLIGAAAGRLLDPHLARVVRFGAQAESSVPASGPESMSLQASTAGDEDFLLEFEAALGSQRVEPLQALDELTPVTLDDRQPR